MFPTQIDHRVLTRVANFYFQASFNHKSPNLSTSKSAAGRMTVPVKLWHALVRAKTPPGGGVYIYVERVIQKRGVLGCLEQGKDLGRIRFYFFYNIDFFLYIYFFPPQQRPTRLPRLNIKRTYTCQSAPLEVMFVRLNEPALRKIARPFRIYSW